MFSLPVLTQAEIKRTDIYGWLELSSHTAYKVSKQFVHYLPSLRSSGSFHSECHTEITSWLGADYALED